MNLQQINAVTKQDNTPANTHTQPIIYSLHHTIRLYHSFNDSPI